MRLSACIIARDDAALLPDALASVEGLVEEIVVVDVGSKDATCAIARAHLKVKLFEIAFAGYGSARQEGLDRCSGDFVLALDADERVSPELALRIRQLVANHRLREFAAFQIRRRHWIYGREMRGMGLYDHYALRLFRRAGARYDARLVHEKLIPAHGPLGRLSQPIDALTLRSVDQYLSKLDRQSDLALQDQHPRFSAWHLVLAPPLTFWRFYLGAGGIRDGLPGLLWAGMASIGVLITDLKLWVEQRLERPLS